MVVTLAVITAGGRGGNRERETQESGPIRVQGRSLPGLGATKFTEPEERNESLDCRGWLQSGWLLSPSMWACRVALMQAYFRARGSMHP